MENNQNPAPRVWTAAELRKLPPEQRDAILADAAAIAEKEYRTNAALTAFEAFGESDPDWPSQHSLRNIDLTDWWWTGILFAGAILGGIVGWLLCPLLAPDGFSELLNVVVIPVGVWIGLLLGYLLARLLKNSW